MLTKLILFLLLLLFSNAYAEVKFTKQCEEGIVKLINNSNKSLDVTVYAINNQSIITALVKAKARGVKIRILTDRLQATGRSSKIEFLRESGFDIRVHSHQRIMHHKFAIFDGLEAVQGSFNWTHSAANKNAEDCNIFKTTEDIKRLQDRFNTLWKLNRVDTSECYFRNMKLDKMERVKCS